MSLDTTTTVPQWFASAFQQLQDQIKGLERLLLLKTDKTAYTTQEIAEMYKRKPETVTEWCRSGHIQAKKVRGKGRQGEWSISAEEWGRLQAEGPSPRGTFEKFA